MALNFFNEYPGRFDAVSTEYPQGKFRNLSAPNVQDGSYLEQNWLNDHNGFFGALLKNAGMTPNGNVDTAVSSQYYNALVAIINAESPKLTVVQTIGQSTTSVMSQKTVTDEINKKASITQLENKRDIGDNNFAGDINFNRSYDVYGRVQIHSSGSASIYVFNSDNDSIAREFSFSSELGNGIIVMASQSFVTDNSTKLGIEESVTGDHGVAGDALTIAMSRVPSNSIVCRSDRSGSVTTVFYRRITRL